MCVNHSLLSFISIVSVHFIVRYCSLLSAPRISLTVNLRTEYFCYLCCIIERERVAKAVTPTRWRSRSRR